MNSMQLLGEAQFHGAKWLATSKYRFYWAFVLIVLFCCSVSVLSVAINRYFQNPTYVAHFEVPQTMKPFPTVVLCPEVEFPKYKIDAFLESVEYPTGINTTYVAEVLPQLGAFFSPDVHYHIEDLEKIQYLLDYNNLSIETTGRLLTLNCQESLMRCRWLNKIINCSSAFRFELTSYGFCCIFNGFSLKREIKEHRIPNTEPHKKLFVNSIGFTNSLMVAVNQSIRPRSSLDLSYKWLVLQTAQYADIIYNGTAISPGVETWAGYTTTTLNVTDDAESLGDELRHCRMVHEPLKYFPIYHKYHFSIVFTMAYKQFLKIFLTHMRYCLLECEMDRVRLQCNCVQAVHPHIHGEGSIPICTAKHIACVRQASGVSFSHDYSICRCPPSCDSEIETTIVSSYDLVQNSHEFDNFYAGLDFNEISIVRVYVLKHNKRITSRHSYFPFHQLFSQLGGVFGVFFGCSILSLLEIVQLAWYATRNIFYQRQAMRKQTKFVKGTGTKLF